MNPPAELHVVSTPQRRRAPAFQTEREYMHVVTPCAVCEGMADEGDACECGLELGDEDFLCYDCQEPYSQCSC